MPTYVYVCPNCGGKHSLKEFKESGFCRQCGKFLTHRNRRELEEMKPMKRTVKKFKLEPSVEAAIEKTYELIQRSTLDKTQIDSLEVVKQVEEYRQFWKPQRTNVVLLAESHVYTDDKDFSIELNRGVLHRIVPNYPFRFVRFVYCLGYGEDKLLRRVRTDRRNSGTPQYWKILSSSVAENENDLGFHRVLKTGTPFFLARLRNKLNILRTMKRKGVWLLDASIVGLYGSGRKNHNFVGKILQICWKNYTANTLSESAPRHTIVIGKGVHNVLYPMLQRLGTPYTVIPQPQARGTSEWQLENYKTYQRICTEKC